MIFIGTVFRADILGSNFSQWTFSGSFVFVFFSLLLMFFLVFRHRCDVGWLSVNALFFCF